MVKSSGLIVWIREAEMSLGRSELSSWEPIVWERTCKEDFSVWRSSVSEVMVGILFLFLVLFSLGLIKMLILELGKGPCPYCITYPI